MPAEPTPGTWRIGDPELCEIFAGDELIAIVYPRRADKGKPPSETERRANLYRILAVNDLYDALDWLCAHAQERVLPCPELVAKAVLALAKARYSEVV